VLLPPMAFAIDFFRRMARRTYREIRERIARINGYLQEAISGMPVIHLSAQEERCFAEFTALNAEHRDANQASNRFEAALFSFVDAVSTVSVAVMLWRAAGLDREALQGVIGHELSHVRNFDIRFSLLVGVLVGSIALLADMYLRYTFWFGGRRSRGASRDGGGLLALLAILSIVLAILAPFIARIVQLAVSRQREFLADASSVELTRNPVGLERALAIIASDREVLEVANRATQHLYFTNPIKKFEARASGLFSTHPPIAERVDRLRELTGRPPLDPNQRAVLSGLD